METNDFQIRNSQLKTDPSLSSYSHDATSRELWFICICLRVSGSFLRVYIVNVGIPINSLKGMRINASIARYVRLPSRETLINCRVKCTYNSSARSYVYISTEIMKSLYIHNIVREINERQFQLRATQRLADTRPSLIVN